MRPCPIDPTRLVGIGEPARPWHRRPRARRDERSIDRSIPSGRPALPRPARDRQLRLHPSLPRTVPVHASRRRPSGAGPIASASKLCARRDATDGPGRSDLKMLFGRGCARPDRLELPQVGQRQGRGWGGPLFRAWLADRRLDGTPPMVAGGGMD
ncbi:hypothetical protein SEVIR_2G279850v4 [Setaria viridis]